MQVYYDSFPQSLNRIAWIEVKGERYYNTNFIGDLSQCIVYTEKNGERREVAL
jgi:hypothetical protein